MATALAAPPSCRCGRPAVREIAHANETWHVCRVCLAEAGVVLPRRRSICCCCGDPATRHVRVDGRREAFCPRCPTPTEIAARAEAIQATWSPAERTERAGRQPVAWGVPGERFARPVTSTPQTRVALPELPADTAARVLHLAARRSGRKWRYSYRRVADLADVDVRQVADAVRRAAAGLLDIDPALWAS